METQEKLTLKELVGYLPYGLKGSFLLSDVVPTHKDELRNKLLTADNLKFFLDYATPHLRPLSDLTKEITHNGETFVPMDLLFKTRPFEGNYTEMKEYLVNNIEFNPYWIIELFQKWHIDYQKLIERGLAIDINTLPNE